MSYAEKETAATAKPENLFSTLEEFEPQFNRLAKVVSRLSTIGDHVEGSRPQEAASPSGQGIDSSMLMGARRKLETLRMLCSQLENEADRTERAIGGLSSNKPTR